MAGNSFGKLFRITSCGESHGPAVAVIIDGCPPGLELSAEDIQPELDRRRPGQSSITSERQEADQVEVLSGVFEGKTTGAPILLQAYNKDARSDDYRHLAEVYRPSHADLSWERKYGLRDWRGGGRSSARETWARVAAGAVAKKYLRQKFGVECLSYVERVGDICAQVDDALLDAEKIESNMLRCPDQDAARQMMQYIETLKSEGDSTGGIIRGVLKNVPPGLGEPVFDKLHADLGKAMLSVNSVKGFEIGAGFEAAKMRGSAHNDSLAAKNGSIYALSNRAGGVTGGVSSGEWICFRVAFKPVATIMKEQKTVNREGEEVLLKASGRHDPCVLPRAVPIVDAMSAIVIMDHYMRNLAQNAD